MMADLIIDDENMNDIIDYLKDFSVKLELYLDDYISILNDIKTKAIISGDISEKLNTFITYVEMLDDSVSGVGSEIEDFANAFLKEVDDKDQYIY